MEHNIKEVLTAIGVCALSIVVYFCGTSLLSMIISDDSDRELLSWVLGGVAFMFLALFCAHLAGLV